MTEWTQQTEDSEGGNGPVLNGQYSGTPSEGEVIEIGGDTLFSISVSASIDLGGPAARAEIGARIHFTNGVTHRLYAEVADDDWVSESDGLGTLAQFFNITDNLSVDRVEVDHLFVNGRETSATLSMMWGQYAASGGGGGKAPKTKSRGVQRDIFAATVNSSNLRGGSMRSTSHNYDELSVNAPLDQPVAANGVSVV